MTDSASSSVRPITRTLAAVVNLTIVVGLAYVAELIAKDAKAPSNAARAFLAAKSLFGLVVIFWLGCGQARTSPGLAWLKLRVVRADAPDERISLLTALLRPLPFLVLGLALMFPVTLIPRSIAPVQFLIVLLGALFVAANATPLWSGPHRRTLMDQWLRTRVVSR